MSHPSRTLAAFAATLGVLSALPFAASAFAAGSKPAPPPAKAGTKPAAPAAAKFATYDELEAAADAAEEASHRDMRKQRYAQVVAYVAANASAADVEKARAAAFELAAEVDDWAKAAQHATEYLAAHAEGPNAFEAKSTKAAALGQLGKKDEAKAAYEDLLSTLDATKLTPDVIQRNIGVFSGYAGFLTDVEDVEGAKAVWQKLKDFYADAEFSGQVAQLAQGQMQSLEQVGQPATAIPEGAKDLEGRPVALDDFKGKVLLIDFWATWCGPCRAEMPNVIAAYKRYHDKGFEVLGVSLDREGQIQKLKDFVAAHKMPWRQIFDVDAGGAVSQAYHVEGIPHTVLVDREGKVLRIGLRGEALDKKLAQLFASK